MQKDIRKSNRQIDRDYQNLLREEEKIKQEMKRAAAQGQNTVVRQLAQQVLRVRQQRERLMQTKGHMSALSHRASTMSSQNTLLNAVKTGATVMTKMNAAMDSAQMSKVMTEFARANEISDMREEMLDDMFDLDGDDEINQEAEDVLDEIFSEQALNVTTNTVPTRKLAANTVRQSADSEANEDDLIARLAGLKN